MLEVHLAGLRRKQLVNPDAGHGAIDIEDICERSHSSLAAIFGEYFHSEQACGGQKRFYRLLHKWPGA